MTQAETRNCRTCKREFRIEPDDFGFYERMGVPAPALCPDCRFQRRAQFRNETTLYSRKCDLCGKAIISMYNPKAPYTIYCRECFESDKWDPYAFGMDYNPNRSFFEQLRELSLKVPKKGLYTDRNTPNVRSDYINYAGGNKDCYLIFNSTRNENAMYSRGLRGCRDVADIYFGDQDEFCYEGINVHESASVAFGQNVSGSLDCYVVTDVSGAQNCIACVNLRNQSYCYMNQKLTKEDYEVRLETVRGSYNATKKLQEEFDAWSLRFPRRENSNIKTVNSMGDYLFESKNLFQCFELDACEDCRYCFSSKKMKDSYDTLGFGVDSEMLLECVATGHCQKALGCFGVESSRNIEYSMQMSGSSDCIGCDGLKNGEHVILNKRYPKEEFMTLREKIVQSLRERGEYGLYFPQEMALFAYNECIAQLEVPLSKEEALAQGYRWEDDVQMTVSKETMKPEAIPDHIKDAPDSITEEILVCVECSRNYRVTPAELVLYRKIVVPLPRKCFYCRHRDRIRKRGPLKTYDRTCAKCSKAIKTSYAPDRPEIVYCEQCYQQEVV
jgi:hypothetical protein